ncbi:MAG: substrate-binding domain-containing protein [Bacteroidales bacterium]|nr:substrate-binding domain-containing protein [Bacteroidales bacterium]
MKIPKLFHCIAFLTLILTSTLFLTSCRENGKSVPQDPTKGNISISGAFALYPLCVRWAEEFNKEYPDIQIDISAGGAGKGMADVLSGMVDLAMLSRGISEEEINKGAWYVAVTRDAVLPTIHSGHPAFRELQRRGLSQQEFRSIYITGEITRWDQLGLKLNEPIKVYTRSDACGAAAVWAEYLGAAQEDLIGLGVFGDPGLADAVKHDPLALGYNNVNYVYDMSSRKKYEQMEVLPIDLNANGEIDNEEEIYASLDDITQAIGEDIYPSPPARELYLISKGKPSSPQVMLFLEWILTKGQAIVSEAGYVKLKDDKVSIELGKLNK